MTAKIRTGGGIPEVIGKAVPTMSNNTHVTGVILIVISAIVFSTAGIFTKGVSAGPWEIIFWRGVFAAGFTTVFVFLRGTFKREFVQMGKSGLSVALVGTAGIAAFIPALKLTTMANVALIFASAPLLAAVLAWLWIGERLSGKLVAACFATTTGVAIIFQGSIGSINIRGDLLALWMTCALAIMMAIYRRYPKTPAAGPAALSSLLLLPPALLLGGAFSVPLDEVLVLMAFGLVFAIASVTLAEGAKRIPAGETALLSVLETPLAPLFGWWFFSEIPPMATFVGGTLILAAVIATQVSR